MTGISRQIEALEALLGVHNKIQAYFVLGGFSYDPDTEDGLATRREFRRAAVGRFPDALRTARQRLVASGFDAPVRWLSVRAVPGFAIENAPDPNGGRITTVRYVGVDAEGVNAVKSEILAWIMKLAPGMEQEPESDRWSKPHTREHWANVFGISPTTFDRRRKGGNDKIRTDRDGKKIRVHRDDLPAT